MNTIQVSFPFMGKAGRKKKRKETKEEEKRRRTKERVAKHRAKVKGDAIRSRQQKKKKTAENKKYWAKIKSERDTNKDLDELIRAEQNARKSKQRKEERSIRRMAQIESELKENREKMIEARRERKNERERRKNHGSQQEMSEKKRNSRVRKLAQRAKAKLPLSPVTWAKTVDHLVRNATPRKSRAFNDLTANGDKTEHDTLKSNLKASVQKKGRPTKRQRISKELFYESPVNCDSAPEKKAAKQFLRRSGTKKMKKALLKHQRWDQDLDSFLEKHSRTMPNKKDTTIVDGERVAKRSLMLTYKKAYKEFKKEHPSYPFRRSSFEKQVKRRKEFKRLNMSHRRVCVCMTHYNNEQRLEALNKLTGKQFTLRSLSDASLCEYQKEPNINCLTGQCSKCGEEKFMTQMSEYESTAGTARWHEWEQQKESYTDYKDGKQKEKKIWVQKEYQGTVTNILASFKKEFPKLSMHLAKCKHQYKVMIDTIKNLGPGDVFALMDFSENLKILYQDEIEAVHFRGGSKAVTIFPVHIIDNEKKEDLIFISNSTEHSARAVHEFTRITIKHINERRSFSRFIRFSDNCSTQFKCADAFVSIPDLQNEFDIVVEYNHSAPGHGKGCSDGMGAVIKQLITRAILAEEAVVNNAEDVYMFLSQHYSENDSIHVFYVQHKDIIRKPKPKRKSVTDTQKFYHIKFDGTQFKAKRFGCGGVCCLHGEGPCQNKEYAKVFKTFKVPGQRGPFHRQDRVYPSACILCFLSSSRCSCLLDLTTVKPPINAHGRLQAM